MQGRNSTYMNKDLRKSLGIMNSVNDKPENIFDHANFIDIPDINNEEKFTFLGNGTCSDVFLVRNIINKQKYVRKAYDFTLFPKHKQNIEREIFYLKRFNQENIIKVYSVDAKNNKINVICDYGSKGTLSAFVSQKGRLNESNSFFYFYQLLNGMNYLHSNNFIIRNLEPENIIITHNDKVLILDLSMCQKVKQSKLSLYDQSEDIWSLGVILYLLAEGINQSKERHRKLSNTIEFKNPISEECQDLIQLLLNADSVTTIKDIFEHPWIKSYTNNLSRIILTGPKKNKGINSNEKQIRLDSNNSLGKVKKGKYFTSNVLKGSSMKCLDYNSDEEIQHTETTRSSQTDCKRNNTKEIYCEGQYDLPNYSSGQMIYETLDERKESRHIPAIKNENNNDFWINFMSAFNCK